MKRILGILVLSVLVNFSYAQKKPVATNGNKMNIEVQVKGLKDTTLILGYHYGSKKLVSDTIRVDSKGKGVFKRDTLLDGGLYLVLTPNMRYFEIILDQDQDFKVYTDTADLFTNLKFEGSVDNQVFLDYQNKSSELYKKRKPAYDKIKYYYEIKDTASLSQKQRDTNRDSIKILQKELETIRKEMVAFEDKIIQEYPTSLLTSILNTTREIEIPDYPRNEKGEITDSLFKYTYLKKHYFDKVQVADSRLLRTPVYEMKIDNYFDRELIQIPDSIIPEVDKLMGRILEQEKKGYEGKMYYYTLHHMFMKYQNPKYMGLDNIFVYIMEQYYLKKKLPARVLADTAYMAKIEKRYNEMSKNRIGIKAPNFVVYSSKEEWMQLQSIQAEYIVLYFWDTDCGHCKKTIPEWHDLYVKNDFKNKGVVSLLFYTQTEMEDWKKFIAEKGLDDCINVFDPYQNTNFRQNYDIYSTPVSYVLDKNKKIIAKRIPPETIVDLLYHELKIKTKPILNTETAKREDNPKSSNDELNNKNTKPVNEKVDESKKQISFNMNGGDPYYFSVNGKLKVVPKVSTPFELLKLESNKNLVLVNKDTIHIEKFENGMFILSENSYIPYEMDNSKNSFLLTNYYPNAVGFTWIFDNNTDFTIANIKYYAKKGSKIIFTNDGPKLIGIVKK